MNKIEQIMCVTGVSLDRAPSWTAATRSKVAGVPKTISRACKAFLDPEEKVAKSPLPPSLDYWETLERIDRGAEEDDHADVLDAMGHDLGAEFLVEQDRIREALAGKFPRTSVQRPQGAVPVAPIPVAWWRWRVSYQVAQAPLVVLDYLKACSITAGIVSSLQALYPGVYADIARELVAEISERAAADKEWRLSHRKDVALQVFLKVSAMPTKLPKALQDAFADEPEPARASNPPPSSSRGELLTPVQRAANT